MQRMTRRTGAAAGLSALIALTLVPGAAYAADPIDIPDGETVVDQAGVLTPGDISDVEAAITSLQDEYGYTVQVVYVDTFTSPSDSLAWAVETAQASNLGADDALLAVAVESGQARFVAGNGTEVSGNTNDIFNRQIDPQLDGQNYAEAGIAAVEGTEAVLADPGGGPGAGAAGDGGGGGAGFLIGLVALAGAGSYFFMRSRRRRQAAPKEITYGPGQASDGAVVDPLASLSVEDLRKRAGSLLIAADDAIKSSEQELGFAEASYGEAAVKPFAADIAAAKVHMSESFKLQQQLDDHIPDTEEQQRAWLGDIIRRCEAVNESLQAHKADFDSLRELERNAPRALEAARHAANAAGTRFVAAEERLTALRRRYAGTATSQVQDNVDQARERLAFVESAAAEARSRMDAGETGPAVVAVRAAEESVSQANLLLDAIDKRAAELEAAQQELDRAVTDTVQDLAQATAMVRTGRHDDLVGPVAAAESALQTVRSQRQAGPIDPIALLERVEGAHRQLDAAIGGVRDQSEQARRARESLQHTLLAAHSRISGTEDYIRARRGGVGSEARTRLAEAGRNLDYAVSIQNSDPVTALSHAEQAVMLAEQAAQLAEQDVSGFGGRGYGGYGGYGARRGGGDGMGGALLGGILLGGLLNGGGGFFGGGGDGGGDVFGGGGFGGFDGGGGGFGGFDGGGGDF
ncbi:TPM domain-containing protein [Arthrobacter crusticola]|uniref:TPM domain-containing protein n=1 Tax=Arthrobacter crusticola TaxID=2547960 RepID=A0A4R5TSV3_9MICC|nr:TPM domain-containing protein [Arthrobacter crusticola]TDK23598.1 TPM domain-containing protein [Arthrobacter crusticola]